MSEEKQSSSSLVWLVLAVLAVVAAGVFMFRGGPTPPAKPATGADAATATGGGSGGGSGAGKTTLSIAVIPKGTTHEFWKTIHAGAVKAERELGAAGTPIKIIWKGPLKEDDRTSQIDVVQNFVGQGVSGIVLAPLDRTALAAPVELAVGAKIPVVIIDSGLESDKQTSFIATNNLEGGKLGGKRLGEVLGGKGKVILLRYQEGSASTEQREAGFLEAMKAFPGIELISTDQHAGATRDTALTASQNVLNRFKDEVAGIFTPNESSTAGMALALKELGLSGKIKHVGFDASEPLLAALKAGDIQGLVVQDPFNMGYLGVKTLVDAISGKPVAKQVDTPVQLVTPENLAQPEIKALIEPPLAEYLGEPAGK
jgi:ribose transport system substrate-binding protein